MMNEMDWVVIWECNWKCMRWAEKGGGGGAARACRHGDASLPCCCVAWNSWLAQCGICPRLGGMNALMALLSGSLVFFLAAAPARGDAMGWNEAALRLRTNPKEVVGVIYAAGGKTPPGLNEKLPPAELTAASGAAWLKVLNEQVLPKLGGKVLRGPAGPVLLADAKAVRVYALMTRPVPKGEYTGWEFLRLATEGVAGVAEFYPGGSVVLRGKFQVKEDVPSLPLGEVMLFVCKGLGGNYWSLNPAAVRTTKDGRPLPDEQDLMPLVIPAVLTVVSEHRR